MIENQPPVTTHELADGVFVDEVVTVDSPDHLSDILGAATASNETVIPFGGRRSLATGNPAGSARWGADLTGLRGIISYEPADLTLSVLAGTTMNEIRDVLAEAGQELPLDVPFPGDTTIGGLVATGFAGPRRLRSGSLRDLLIGCEFVRGDGLLAKAGGMVVKNVSGFEIPRFLHGSWGALAVLTSVNLKVTPVARADGSLTAEFDDVDVAIAAALGIIAGEPSIESCVVTINGNGVKVAVRAMGRIGAVAAMLDSFGKALGSTTDRIEAETSRDYWQALVNDYAEDPSRIVISMSTRPRDIHVLTRQFNEIGTRCGAEILVSPGLGSLRIRLPGAHQQAAGCASDILGAAARLNVRCVLESAPLPLRSAVSTWGADPEGIDLMRSVKRQFDPANVLNPGRLFL
ncbi:MAG: FAD-binding protein [Thermomicrobiales bacterium]